MPTRLAVPNKGRLQTPTTNLLKQGGLSYEKTDRALAVPVRNMDLEVLFVRTDDVPEFVSDGVRQLCERARIYPCVLDAAIFTSFDRGGWTTDGLIW